MIIASRLRLAFVGGLVLPHSSLCLSRSPLPYTSRIAATRQFGLTTCLPMSSRRSGGRGGGGGRGSSNRRRSGGGRGGGRSRRPRAPPPPIPPPGQPGRGCFRELVVVGNDVFVVKKDDQRSGTETQGTVARHLTKSSYHPRGIKVMLESGEVGRVTRFIE